MAQKTKIVRGLVAAFAVCFSASTNPGWGLADPPLVRYMASGPRTKPIWIDLQAATAADGSIDWQFFEEGDKDRFSTPPDIDPETGDCLSYFGEPISDRIDPRPNGTLQDLQKYANAIYSGEIIDLRPGFFEGVPYSLAKFRITRTFRTSQSIATDYIEVPIPYANFDIGSKKFCTNGSMGYRPNVGNRAILFLYDPAIDADRRLVTPKYAETVFEDGTGKLYFAPGLRSGWLSAAGFKDVENFLGASTDASVP